MSPTSLPLQRGTALSLIYHLKFRVTLVGCLRISPETALKRIYSQTNLIVCLFALHHHTTYCHHHLEPTPFNLTMFIGSFKFIMESVKIMPLDTDDKKDPIIETWNRMKSAATAKIVKAVSKKIDGFKHNSLVRILDADPSAYASIAIDVASRDPHTAVVVTSESANILEQIRADAVRHNLSGVKVHTHDERLEGFQDNSFDIVVCSFGNAFLNSPGDTLKEFHRVLKPEGSLILSISENFAMEHLFHFIVDEMLASGNLEDFTYLESDSPVYFSPCVEPHSFENLLAEGGFDLAHVDHEVARIVLTDASYKDDIEGYTVEELAKNGKNKKALARAKLAFLELTKDPSLVSRDKCGNLVTTLPRQFKIMTATRKSANP